MKDFNSTYSIDQHKYEIDYPHDFRPSEIIIERERELDLDEINGHVNEMIFNGICIERRNVQLNRSMDVEVRHKYPFLKMHFELKGYSIYLPSDDCSLQVEIPGGHHQLFFFPEVNGKLHYEQNMHRDTLEITLSIEFIQRVFSEECELLVLLDNAIKNNSPIVVGSRCAAISPRIRGIIDNITNCPITGVLKKRYLEAKITELLIVQIQELDEYSSKLSLSQLSGQDLVRMENLMAFLKDNFSESLTIDYLATEFGVNTSKLKSDFKQFFDEPIFGCITRLRMEFAFKEIRNTSKSITQIAEECGYNYVQHFTKAFRKYYGILPSKLRVSIDKH